jgi:DNA-directed RNA polymerase subunit E'/Rpb7
MDDIKVTTTLLKSIVLKANQLNKNIDANLLKVFKKEYEGRCISEGYLIPDKTKLLKRSVGNSRSSHFTGDFTFDSLFKVELYNPVRDNIIECHIQRINELGIQSIVGPMQIVVPKELHLDKSLFKDLKVGDKIKVSVIARRFDLFDTVIYLTAKLAKDVGKIDILEETQNTITYATDSDDELISSDEEEIEISEGEEAENEAIEVADEAVDDKLSVSETEDAGEDEEVNEANVELQQEEFDYESN